MKKPLPFFPVLLFLFAMLSGCNKNAPKDVAQTWLTSFYHMDYDAAKKLSTDDTKNFISLLQQFTPHLSDSDKIQLKKSTVTIKDIKVNGNSASVIYNTSEMPDKDQPLMLIKKGNKWLVQFSKSDQQTAGVDTTGHQAVQPDTTAPAIAPAEDTLNDSDKD